MEGGSDDLTVLEGRKKGDRIAKEAMQTKDNGTTLAEVRKHRKSVG